MDTLYEYRPVQNRSEIKMNTSWFVRLQNPELIAERLKRLRDVEGVQFDTIVGTGLSGTLPLLYVANALGVKWLAIRKDNESTHTGTIAEGSLGKRWLFLDDFMETGSTLARVEHLINNRTYEIEFETKFVGAFFYHLMGTSREFFPSDHLLIRNAITYYRQRKQQRSYYDREEENRYLI